MDGQIQHDTLSSTSWCLSLNGLIFLKSVDALGQYKDAQYMGELFIKVIEDVGVDSCVQNITDNAPICKVVGIIL